MLVITGLDAACTTLPLAFNTTRAFSSPPAVKPTKEAPTTTPAVLVVVNVPNGVHVTQPATVPMVKPSVSR